IATATAAAVTAATAEAAAITAAEAAGVAAAKFLMIALASASAALVFLPIVVVVVAEIVVEAHFHFPDYRPRRTPSAARTPMRTHVTANFCFVGEFVFSRTLRNFAPPPVNATGSSQCAYARGGSPAQAASPGLRGIHVVLRAAPALVRCNNPGHDIGPNELRNDAGDDAAPGEYARHHLRRQVEEKRLIDRR